MIPYKTVMAITTKAFGKKQRRTELAVKKAPKYRRLTDEAKKQIFADMDSGVSLRQPQVLPYPRMNISGLSTTVM